MGVNARVGVNKGTLGEMPRSSSLVNRSQTDFQLGLHYASRIKKQIFISSGLNYSIYGFGYSREKDNTSLPLNANKESIRYRFTTLNVPISLYLYTSEYRLRSFVQLMGGLHFQINEKKYATYTLNENAPVTESIEVGKNFALINPSIGFAFGWEYDWEQDLSVRIAPYIAATFLPGKTQGQIFSFGLSFSAQFQQN